MVGWSPEGVPPRAVGWPEPGRPRVSEPIRVALSPALLRAHPASEGAQGSAAREGRGWGRAKSPQAWCLGSSVAGSFRAGSTRNAALRVARAKKERRAARPVQSTGLSPRSVPPTVWICARVSFWWVGELFLPVVNLGEKAFEGREPCWRRARSGVGTEKQEQEERQQAAAFHDRVPPGRPREWWARRSPRGKSLGERSRQGLAPRGHAGGCQG